jgi:hypothetical protein
MTNPQELARGYRDKAARCRRLARQTTDREIGENLWSWRASSTSRPPR